MDRTITRRPALRDFAERFNEIDQWSSLLISGTCSIFAAIAITGFALAAIAGVLP